MNRRTLLRGAAALLAGAGGLRLFPSAPREVHAFGEVPNGAGGLLLPPGSRAERVLEVFLYGGLSQYESFYCVPDHGQNDKTGYHLFLASGDVDVAVSACGLTGELAEPFAQDTSGQLVHLGPFVAPLRERPDIIERMRISITAHDLEPHEGAIPLALAGRPLGHPASAGLGAHVQRYFAEREALAGGNRGAPFAYVLSSTALNVSPNDNVNSAVATGLHPGAARPLLLKTDAPSKLTSLLERSALGGARGAYDAAMQGYVDRYRARLRWGGSGEVIRSPRAADVAAAHAALANSDVLVDVLEPKLLEPKGADHCGDTAPIGTTAMNLRLAAHLLTHPTAPARYCCVVDAGLLKADGGGGYDTHYELPHTQARNLSHTLRELARLIRKPGEDAAGKIDLDETLVVLTTEFGRTPYLQGAKGRNHWPYGYPIVFIGGPIRGPQRGVFGATTADARAQVASSPQENRIAALLALGIWPFSPEAFSVSDVPGASGEIEAAALVLSRQLGLQS